MPNQDTDQFTPCRIFIWPLGDRPNMAVVTQDNPTATIAEEFCLVGATDEERLEEMRQWVIAHQGYDITTIDDEPVLTTLEVNDGVDPEMASDRSDFHTVDTAITGFTFKVPAATVGDWRVAIRGK